MAKNGNKGPIRPSVDQTKSDHLDLSARKALKLREILEGIKMSGEYLDRYAIRAFLSPRKEYVEMHVQEYLTNHKYYVKRRIDLIKKYRRLKES